MLRRKTLGVGGGQDTARGLSAEQVKRRSDQDIMAFLLMRSWSGRSGAKGFQESANSKQTNSVVPVLQMPSLLRNDLKAAPLYGDGQHTPK